MISREAIDKARKVTVEKAREIAKSRGGKCLSENYGGSKSKLEWECSKGHIWFAIFGNVSRSSWCPVCAIEKNKLGIEKMQEIAKERGGKCLSSEYKNAHSKLKWECSKGHVWEAKPHCIMNDRGKGYGTWCPYCSSCSSEEICRVYFETIFACKFNKTRPDWLIGIKNVKLELDGLSDKMFNGKYLAFEHDGYQHYCFEKFLKYHARKDLNAVSVFETHRANDSIKDRLCGENNIILFRIPQLFELTKIENLKNLIKNIALKNGIDIDINIDVDISSTYISKDKIIKYKNIVESKGGKVLNGYVSVFTKLKILCANGHVFEMTPNNIQQGQWCAYCINNNIKHTIEEAKNIAKERGGRCLSEKYGNNKTRLEWECSRGHVWLTSLKQIMHGNWCPVCCRIKQKEIDES